MRKKLLTAVLIMLSVSCVKDPNPHCWKCTLHKFKTIPEKQEVTYTCGQTEAEIRAFERSQTDFVNKKVEMICGYRSGI